MTLSSEIAFPEYAGIRRVDSFGELAGAQFVGGVNALCWGRTLPGDFGEIVRRLGAGEGIVTVDEDELRALPLSHAGQVAVQVILDDLRRLRELERDPVLNCIHGYPRDEEGGAVATDVFSFHADSAPVEADTWLCTYHGSPSEGLRNEDAVRRVEVPATRAELLQQYGGGDDEGFAEFLRENCFDLHYAAKAGAVPYSFGVGNLWRISVDWPGSRVPPCVHRAPATIPGEPRLMVIC